MNSALVAAVWGFAGAVCYAAPRWSTCAFTAREQGGKSDRCTAEATIALLVGTVASGASGPWLADLFGQVEPKGANMVFAAVGLISNPLAPKLADLMSGAAANLLSDRVLKYFKERREDDP